MNATERGGLRGFFELTLTLAISEFKTRYYGSALGYLWSLARPLLLFAVLYVAFTEIIEFGDEFRNYPAVLILGLVLYTYFAETTGQAVNSLVVHESLIRKVPVPILAIPLSIALRAFFTLALNLVAVFIFFALTGVEVTWDWLQLPLLLVALLLFSTAAASLLANLFVPFRDTGQIWEVGLQLMFWGSPIIYPIEKVPEGLREWIMLSPLADIIAQARHALIDPEAMTAAEAAGGPERLVIPALIVLSVLAISAWTYRRVTPRIAEQL